MNASLKDTHPQKYYMRIFCKAMFYHGLGTYWYEVEKLRYPRLYTAWCLLINAYVFLGTLNKILALFRPDMSNEAKSEILQLACTEGGIILKFYILRFKRNEIREVLKKMLNDYRDIFTSKELEAKAVKKAKYLSYLFWLECYLYLIMTFIQITVVTYYKKGVAPQFQLSYFQSTTTGFDLLRILIIFHTWALISMVLSLDCFCMTSLIFVAAKFKQVQVYFEMIGEISEKDWKVEDFKNRVINGIKLHEHALWSARSVQSAMGNLYGVQVYLTTILLGLNMLKLANAERTMVNLFVSLFYSLSIAWATGCYMLNAGEITYEAAGVATAVFHCGWERGRTRSARALLVMAMQRAQEPVLMTAFGIFILSHETFVSVLRAAYSFYAVIY